MASLPEDLQMPSAFPDPVPSHIQFIETHISWLFLTPHHVYKVKRPVDFGFLNYTSPALRKKFCEAEVRLNLALAPGVYFGVLPIYQSREGVHSFRPTGPIVDWAVHMKRLPEERRADCLLCQAKLEIAEIDLLAKKLVEFHARSDTSSTISQFGSLESIQRNVQENFDQCRVGQDLEPDLEQSLDELEHWQKQFMASSGDLLGTRMSQGRIRSGHGDLRLEQIYLQEKGEFVILDCIEFNDRFRYGDVCSDLSFLSMDLAFHERADLGERLLSTYAREANDYDLYQVANFYQSYRACVRGKVALLRTHDPDLKQTEREALLKKARKYFSLANALSQGPRHTPSLCAVGGGIASGKSTLSEWLSRRTGAPVISTDWTRKNLLGIPPTQQIKAAPWSGAYHPQFTDEVYAEALRRAEIILNSGRSVILDASFRSPELRDRARELAKSLQIPFRFIECQVPFPVCRQRLKEREHSLSVSDARENLLDEFSSEFKPADEIPAEEYLSIDTSQPLEKADLTQITLLLDRTR